MTSVPFVSYAQNGEDVVLWRALGHVEDGRYVDVGANSPTEHSVTKAFYERGWHGLDVEPVATFADALRAERPRDAVAQVVVTDRDGQEVVLHQFDGTGLSTLRDEYAADHSGHGFAGRDVRLPARRLDSLVQEHLPGVEVHFCKVDVEGAEAEVLRSVDLRTWRPWVLVVEATRPLTAEATHVEWDALVQAAGYRFCLFDGLSRFYVAEEHAELAPALSYPACVLDDYVPVDRLAEQRELRRLQQEHHRTLQELDAATPRVQALESEVRTLRAQLLQWRAAAVERWAAAVGSVPVRRDDGSAAAELERMRQTLSWRVTAPLRVVRARQLRARA